MRTIRAKGVSPCLSILYAACTEAKQTCVLRPHRRALESYLLAKAAGWYEMRAVSPMRKKRLESNRLAAHDPDDPNPRVKNDLHELRQVSKLVIRRRISGQPHKGNKAPIQGEEAHNWHSIRLWLTQYLAHNKGHLTFHNGVHTWTRNPRNQYARSA